jgi:hypothetical protein
MGPGKTEDEQMSGNRVAHFLFGLVVSLGGLAFLAPIWIGSILNGNPVVPGVA